MSQRIKIECSRRALAAELSLERDTLERRASRIGVDLDNLYLRDLVKMLTADKAAAIEKKLETETTLNEIEIKEKQGKLVDRSEVEADLWGNQLLPFRNGLFKLAKKHKLEKELDLLMAEHLKNIK